jgi:hypothetical protein
MSALINFSLRVDKLPKEKFVAGKDGAHYYNGTISINDETNEWGQNVSIIDSQTKEERDAKKQKTYLGNGKVVWNDGKITNAVKTEKEQAAVAVTAEDDLPF